MTDPNEWERRVGDDSTQSGAHADTDVSDLPARSKRSHALVVGVVLAAAVVVVVFALLR